MARHPAETISVLTYRTGVQDANIAGNVHGGHIMKLCDDAAGIAATRLAGGRGGTPAGDAVKVRSPLKGGGGGTPRSCVTAAWGTSMGGGVRVEAENVVTGAIRHTCTAYLTMVALGPDGKPVVLEPLEPAAPDEIRRHRGAQRRRSIRLADPGASLHISALGIDPPAPG